MKRLYVALAILVTVIVLCVVSLNLQTNSINHLMGMIDKMQQSFDEQDLGTCREVSYKFVDEYKERTRFFPFFMRHSDVDEIEQCATILPVMLENGDTKQYIVELTKCRNQLEKLSQLETPIPENIL